jgi:hypothetical protein
MPTHKFSEIAKLLKEQNKTTFKHWILSEQITLGSVLAKQLL